MSYWLAIALQTIGADAQEPIDLAKLSKPILAAPRCHDAVPDEEIVVCARNPDRYRLPLASERSPLPDRARGEAQTGLNALTRPSRCGIFAGERRCDKREAAQYGYGEGRDPITVLTRLAGKAIDPDGN